jgi:hypothetical protein
VNPLYDGSISVPAVLGAPILGDGIGLAKNAKTGVFSFGASNGDVTVTLTGKYVLDKFGVLKKVSGKFLVQDFIFPCFITGSFKAKNLNP